MGQYCNKHKVYYLKNCVCVQCLNEADSYAQNFKHSDKIEITFCKNKDEAQALANLLWNEKHRHYKDISNIIENLILLRAKWGVEPSRITAFVKP